MAMGLAAWAGLAGSIVLYEGVMMLLEEMVGDPEAEVEVALTRLAERNQREALGFMAREQLGKEQVGRIGAAFNELPSRILSSAALRAAPQPYQDQDTGVLDMVSQRMGMTPQMMRDASNPSRMGDMSQVYRKMGASPGAPLED